MRILVLNPMTQMTGNVIRDVVYGCWCNGKRIGGATLPPFTLISLATILRQDGFQTDFLDAQAEQTPIEIMRSRIKMYDLVVMSSSTMSFQDDASYLLLLKKVNPKLKTIIFGSHPTFMPRYCLAHEAIDFVIRYEPEFVLKELVALLASQGDYQLLEGIGYKKDSCIVVNEQRPFIDDLDQLPFVDVDLLPRGVDYFNPIVKRIPYMTISTSRGCPGKCTFCTAATFDGSFMRFQSADYVIEEIKYFISRGIKEVYFRDDTFFVNKKRDRAIFEYIIKNKLDITWLANGRVDLLDEEILKMAKQAGCHTIKIGIESGVQEILDGMKKGYRIEDAPKVFEWAGRHKLRTHAHIMLGNPSETKETIMQTIQFVLKLNPTTATFGICTPYPGTPLFKEVQEKYPQIADGSSSDLSKLHVQGLFNEHFTSLKKDELAGLVRYAYRRFYLRPTYWIKSLFDQIKGVDDVRRLTIAATNIFNFIIKGEN